MHVIEDIKLDVKNSPSLVLCDLSEFATLAFVAAFDIGGAPQISSSGASDTQKRTPQKRVTYIALCKYSLSRLVDLFLRFKHELDVYNDGTLEQVLSVSLRFFQQRHRYLEIFSFYSAGVFHSHQT